MTDATRTPPAVDLVALDPAPAGFPGCPGCAYRRTGTPALCLACATDAAPPEAERPCPTCGSPLLAGGACPNTCCNLPERWFSRIYTVSEGAEPMWETVCRYKYEDDRRWADLLGRLVAGYLEQNRAELGRFDVLTTGAIYVGPQAARLWDYLTLVVGAAREQAPGWAVEPGLITKAGPTGRFLGIGVEERRAIAEGDLRRKLAVPDPARVAGRRVLVFDDVYSEGFSLREMARVLVQAGAVEVAGLVLARRKGG